MTLQKIAGQFRQTAVQGEITPNSWPETVIAIGIQAHPDSTIQFEGGNKIHMGLTGIYEINVEGFGYIPKPTVFLPQNGTVLIDYIYFIPAEERN